MAQIKTILRISGSLLSILALLMLTPLIITIYYREPLDHSLIFIYSAMISFLIGMGLRIITQDHEVHMNLATSMILCAVAWILLSILGSLPFMFGLGKSFIDAFFEAVSGFTTTGITVFENLESIPKSILFWRGLIQWVGGLGILTFFLFITTSSEGEIWQLFSAEGHKISSSRPVPNVKRTIKYFWAIYGLFTVIEVILLRLLGISIFESMIHSFTTLSTGGFSNHDASIGYYEMAGYTHYREIEYVVTFFMFLGGVNFLIHYKMLKEDPLIIFKDMESKTFLKIIGGFTIITVLSIYIHRGIPLNEFEEVFRKTLFQIVSIITTTGFETQGIGSVFFPAITKQLFMILMIVGGCVGSTAGGIKVMRLVILNKLLGREIKKIHLPPGAVTPTTINGINLGNEELLRVAGLVFGWIVLIAVGSGITALFSDLGPFEAFSGMASAVGNIGPFYFSVEKMVSLSPIIKLTYIVGMLAGRLELLPIYILISRQMWC